MRIAERCRDDLVRIATPDINQGLQVRRGHERLVGEQDEDRVRVVADGANSGGDRGPESFPVSLILDHLAIEGSGGMGHGSRIVADDQCNLPGTDRGGGSNGPANQWDSVIADGLLGCAETRGPACGKHERIHGFSSSDYLRRQVHMCI